MADDAKKAQRGGRRLGAGRPPKETVGLHLTVRPETLERLRRKARDAGLSISALIDRIADEF